MTAVHIKDRISKEVARQAATVYKITGVDFEGKILRARYFRYKDCADEAFEDIEYGGLWRDNPFSGWPEGTFEKSRKSDSRFWIRLEVKKP